jgi:hypothetical protein
MAVVIVIPFAPLLGSDRPAGAQPFAVSGGIRIAMNDQCGNGNPGNSALKSVDVICRLHSARLLVAAPRGRKLTTGLAGTATNLLWPILPEVEGFPS